ncbi:LysE family translocator [Hydrogenophaga sp. BPS33]|uniref:LysE family translocator n=1 Tax=Hydrogenophaga sp. BPS33 TaxID=2651974 RepID=UPI00131F564B|nr:LysE family translocator [Hydrogenophaga sp. BPS33]QHE88254.1 LysE family translocator [Hydrogenophaga sp. BPS33]
MPDLPQLLLFIVAGWLLNLTPGPDVLYIVNHSLRNGVRAGMVAALGIFAGCFVHVAIATVGLGALLATSATAFTMVKVIGAAYLLWMGVRLLRAATPGWSPDATPAEHDMGHVFRRGFLTNVLNPKVALFFLAFLPQFIAPATQHKTLAFLALGLLFSVNALPVTLGYAWAAAWAARRVQRVRSAMHWLDRAAGLLFIGFGLKLAFTDNPAP